MQSAQCGEHSNPQADLVTRPLHRGEGLHDRLPHEIVGALTISGKKQANARNWQMHVMTSGRAKAPVSQVAAVLITLSIIDRQDRRFPPTPGER